MERRVTDFDGSAKPRTRRPTKRRTQAATFRQPLEDDLVEQLQAMLKALSREERRELLESTWPWMHP